MQHLYLPGGQHLEPVDIAPYVASDNYKETTFLLYLDHAGKRHLYDSWFSVSNDAEDIACLVQTWLVFSLLQFVLGPFFKHEEYVREEVSPSGETRLVVDTTPLSQAIREHKLSDEFEKLSPSDTNKLFDLLLSATYRLPSHQRFRVFVMQALSVMAVVRFLKAAGRNHSWWRFYDIKLRNLYPVDLELMVKQGWCPHQARQCWKAALSFEAQMVLRTSSRDDGYDHISCLSTSCANDGQAAASTNLPAHCTADCRCAHFVVNPHMFRAVLLSGTFPLLRIDLDKTETAQRFVMVPCLPSTPYVAISHVWSEGLGNPSNNSLPYCQLEQLAIKVERLLRIETDFFLSSPTSSSTRLRSVIFRRSSMSTAVANVRSKRKFWIWLDTLCCPISPLSFKALSLSKTELIFRGAIRTLVLSASCQRIDGETLDLFQLGLHVIHSTWMHRLWTFTEGSLSPHNLCFQFRGRIVSYNQLLHHIEEHIKSPVPDHWGLSRDIFEGLWLLCRFYNRHPAARRQPTFLSFIYACLDFRGISSASDEPICLALLAHKHVLAKPVTHELGMVHFWKTCVANDLIDSDIIFHRSKTLSSPGFRWAPYSLFPLAEKFNKINAPVTSLLPRLVLSRDGVVATSAAYYSTNSERKRCFDRFASDIETSSRLILSGFERESKSWFKIFFFRPLLAHLQDLTQEGGIAFLVHPKHSHQGKFGMMDAVVGLIPHRQQSIYKFLRLGSCLIWTFPPSVNAKIDRIINDTKEAFREIQEDQRYWAPTLFRCGLKSDEAQDVIEEKLNRFVAEVTDEHYLEIERLARNEQWLLD